MNVMQPTTSRRLWWLTGIAGLLIAVIVVGVLVRMHQVRTEAQQHRAAGLRAVEAGDYEQAIGLLGSYLNHEENDVEALYRFAQARRAVEQPERRHFAAAATALQQVVRLDPDHLDATRELADLYMVGGRHEEALEAADRVLEDEPNDSTALGVKVVALRQLDRHDAAIAVAIHAAEVDPEELDWHLMVLDLHREADQPQAALRYARQWHGAHEDDPRAVLILAAAHQLAGQDGEALDWLERAAANPVHEATFVRELAERFDALGQHERASEIIEQASRNDPEPSIARLHARRLWQLDRPADVLAYLDGQEKAALTEDVELTAIETLASVKLDQRDRAAARIQALSDSAAPLAQRWADLLDAVAEPDGLDPLRVVDRASAVLGETPDNPEALFLLGQAYAAIDEPYAAISAWTSAAERAPAWADPLLAASDVARAHPHAGNAASFAREAQRRAPQRVEAAAAVVLALAERTQVNVNDTQRLLATVEQIQTQHRFEPRTLPLYLALLSYTGQAEQATAVARDLLEADVTLAETTWLRLARVTRSLDADLAEQMLSRSADEHGPTPTLALARALHHRAATDDEAGQTAFDQTREAAKADDADTGWGLAQARYMEVTGDAKADETWTRLGDRETDDLSVQLAVVRAKSTRDNRALRRRAVERMEQLTEQRGYTWRLEHARWLADHPDASHAHLVEALQRVNSVLDRVPDHIEARLLAARCLAGLGNDDAALNHLRAAQQRRPQDLMVNLQLAAVLQGQGDFPAARRPLAQFAALATLQADQQWRLTAIGDPTNTHTLESTFAEQVSPAVLAARHDWLRGDTARAGERLEDLLTAEAQPALSLPTLTLAADFYAGTGDWTRAEAVAARLSDHDLPAGSVDLLLADLHHRYRGPEAAAARYRDLTQATPDNRFAWRERIGMAVSQGRIDDALAAAAEAQTVADDATWDAVLHAERVLRIVEVEPELRALGAAIVREPEHRDVARGAMELIASAHAQPRQRTQLMPRLRALAAQHPGLPALQHTVIRLLYMTGEQDEAVRLARRAMRQFPDATEPAELALQMLQAGEAWDTLIEVAEEHKRLDPARSIAADTLIAATYVRTDRPTEAIEQLAPRLATLHDDPETHFDTLATYAHALTAAGQSDDAAAMMRPWLSASPQWRQAWRWMAGLVVTDAETAAAWLEELADHVPADAFAEQLDLIHHWRMLARRFDRPASVQTADDRLAALAEHPDAPPVVHVQHGQAAEAADRSEQAEASYRRALELDSDHAPAIYHLARLLARENRSLDEALTLARQVAEAQPNVADHLDVLAFVSAQAGRYDEALAAVRQLRDREADQPLWQLTHAWVLVKAGEREQARTVYALIADQLPGLQPLPTTMADRLAQVHEALPELAELGTNMNPPAEADSQ